ncbi:transglutaminase-like domain-containing protein [Gulosibacter bifidus]|uniref:Transglutaminase family protein n=1 Tax=Gulosibacter bifidus TaxID=272239 RepID=A0ABW5RIU0_9MICO|nr:transglutaminase domain-containing protein [Gulosibacter bifidus]
MSTRKFWRDRGSDTSMPAGFRRSARPTNTGSVWQRWREHRMLREQPARFWSSLALIAAMLIPSVFAHEPVFGQGVGLRGAIAGVLLGLMLALTHAMFAWRWWLTLSVGVVVYFALGGLVALPGTLTATGFPTADTLQLLAVQIIHSWKDLLTLVPPAATFTGPTVLPFLVSFVLAFAAAHLAFRGRWLFATLPVVGNYVIGAAWSVPVAPFALWWGAGFAALVAIWWALGAAWDRRSRGEEIVVGREARDAVKGQVGETTGAGMLSVTERTTDRTSMGSRRVAVPWLRQLLGVVGTLGVGVLIAGLLVPIWGAGQPRHVLRDYIAPPLDVHDLPTPLEQFRHLSADLADAELMTVAGLPNGARVRFATMNQYDGVRWGIAPPEESTAGFFQVGEVIAPAQSDVDPGVRQDYDVIVKLNEPMNAWIPTVGHLEGVRLESPEVAAALFYDRDLQTAMTTASVPKPLHYTMQGWNEPKWNEGQLSGRGLGGDPVASYEGVPDEIASLAADITLKATSPLDRARALERYFRETGFYANGTQAPSRPGHSSGRINELLEGEQMVGDDEQYATAMAMAATSLGMPARVVMGAYPKSYGEGPQKITGDDVHVWVEIQFQGAGWVPFDPTPPKDQTPQTEMPEPKSVPQPQVLQPPEPPREPPELPAQHRDREPDDPVQPPVEFPWLAVGGATALSLLLLLPLLGVPLYKLWRRRKRKREGGREGVRNAWLEASDYANDTGMELGNSTSTVLERAEIMEAQRDLNGAGVALARQVGAAEFSGVAVSDAQVAHAWQAEQALRQALMPASVWERYRARLSWRTIGRRKYRERAAKRSQREQRRQRRSKRSGAEPPSTEQ